MSAWSVVADTMMGFTRFTRPLRFTHSDLLRASETGENITGITLGTCFSFTLLSFLTSFTSLLSFLPTDGTFFFELFRESDFPLFTDSVFTVSIFTASTILGFVLIVEAVRTSVRDGRPRCGRLMTLFRSFSTTGNNGKAKRKNKTNNGKKRRKKENRK